MSDLRKITAITQQQKNKDRYNLFLDGEFLQGVSLETIMKFHLKEGLEIDLFDLKKILDENDKIEALNTAVNYLADKLKTKRQIKDYIVRKGYSEEIAWYCVDKLKEYGYVDDAEFSKRYIESVSNKNGKRLVEYKLMMKGVRKEDVEKAYETVDVDAKDNAKVLAEKHIKNKERTKENLVKTYRYLVGKGFSYEEATYAIDCLKEEK